MEYENDQRGYDGLFDQICHTTSFANIDGAQTSLVATNAIAAGRRVLTVAM